MDWMLGWTPPEPPHLKETMEETLARELNQVSEGWTGSPTYPRIPILVWWQPFTGDDGLQTCGHTPSPCLGRRERTGRCSTRRAPRTTPYSPMLPSLSISTTPPPSGGQAQCPSPLNILRA